MCVFFLALSPYRKTMRDGKSASKPNPHIFAQLSRMRKQLVACCKKLFLKVDKTAVKKLGKAPKDIVGKYPIVRMLAFQCGCAMLLISTSAWPQSRKSAMPNNVAPTKDEKYAHYSWISGRCRSGARTAPIGKKQHRPLYGSGERFPSLAEWQLQPKLPLTATLG